MIIAFVFVAIFNIAWQTESVDELSQSRNINFNWNINCILKQRILGTRLGWSSFFVHCTHHPKRLGRGKHLNWSPWIQINYFTHEPSRKNRGWVSFDRKWVSSWPGAVLAERSFTFSVACITFSCRVTKAYYWQARDRRFGCGKNRTCLVKGPRKNCEKCMCNYFYDTREKNGRLVTQRKTTYWKSEDLFPTFLINR